MTSRVLAGLALAIFVAPVRAQEGDHNFYLRAGTAAAADGDYGTYYSSLRLADAAIPAGHINRPFVQYHLARAAALTGHHDEVFESFDEMWRERIESLMMVFAEYDPAFDPVREDPRFAAAFDRIAGLRIETTRLRGDVFLLEGSGSNLVAQVGEDGALLVDIGYAPALPAVRRAVASLGSQSIDYVVVTHAHEDHMGGNSGIGSEATVLAHPDARATMVDGYDFIDGVTVPSRTGDALPDIEVQGPLTLHFNGEEIRVIPLPAHSGGDLIVYFSTAGVLHMGDDYFPGATPYLNPGEDPMAYLETLESLLETIPEDGLVVAGHDPVTPVADLRALFERTRAAVSHVVRGIESGQSVDEIVASGDPGDAEERYLRYFYRLLEARD